MSPAREDGFTLVELVMTMLILGLVLTGVTALFSSGIRAQSDLQARFDAQTELRVGLDKLKREVHASCAIVSQTSIQLTVSNPPCTAPTTITYCTQGSGTRYGLYRNVGSTCGGTKIADYLTSGGIFTYFAPNSPSSSFALARVRVDVTADAKPSTSGGAYHVIDDVVFRNSARQ